MSCELPYLFRMNSFNIAEHAIGPTHPVFIVAEVAQAHDGSLGMAHAYVDAAAEAGVDAVKFQTHIAAAESTPGEPWRVKFSLQDASRYDYWGRMEFTEEQWAGLASHARERGLVFLSSPFSHAAMDLLEEVHVPAWKFGAGETMSLDLIERAAKTGKPVLLSTGMTTWEELDRAVECVHQHGSALGIYQCSSIYPCPPEHVGLNVLNELRDRYQCPVGLSDHSGSMYAGLAAAALGVDLLEIHMVLSTYSFGPDVASSVTVEELKQLVDGVRQIETMVNHPVDKDAAASNLEDMRGLFRKSIVAGRECSKGHVLSREDLAFKKPGSGIPVALVESVVGRTLKHAVPENKVLSEDDFE